MKIKYLFINLADLLFWIMHGLFAKYDVVDSLVGTLFAMLLVIFSPIIYSVINSCVQKTALSFIIANCVFALCHMIGLWLYDIIVVGSQLDTFRLLAGPSVGYIAVITVIIAAYKHFKLKD